MYFDVSQRFPKNSNIGQQVGILLHDRPVSWWDLFYCDTCSKLCALFEDVTEEVVAYFCGHCLENVPTVDATLQKFRCLTCWECPACTRRVRRSGAQKQETFNCPGCQWEGPARADLPWAPLIRELSHLNHTHSLGQGQPDPRPPLTLGDLLQRPSPGPQLGPPLVAPTLEAKQEAPAPAVPKRVKLVSRRQIRCRECQTLLAKPTLSPCAPTQFTLNKSAYLYVPEVLGLVVKDHWCLAYINRAPWVVQIQIEGVEAGGQEVEGPWGEFHLKEYPEIREDRQWVHEGPTSTQGHRGLLKLGKHSATFWRVKHKLHFQNAEKEVGLTYQVHLTFH